MTSRSLSPFWYARGIEAESPGGAQSMAVAQPRAEAPGGNSRRETPQTLSGLAQPGLERRARPGVAGSRPWGLPLYLYIGPSASQAR
jgi:hypothetical protein